MNPSVNAPVRSAESVLATNKVLRNTYMLLSLTLFWSAMMAGVSMTLQMPPATYLVSMVLGLVIAFFVLPRTANTGAGLITVFVFTGLLGFGIGPILNQYLALSNGPQIIAMALGGTAAIFLALSGYVLTTQKDFSFLGGFLMVGFLVVIGAAILNIFMGIPALQLTISAAVIFIMSGFILFDTSRIIHGGETNYIMATVGMYLNIFNIFISLLQILGIFGGDD